MKKINLPNKKFLQKGCIVSITALLIVSFFPKKSKFKYEFEKGQIWQYEDLYAPFDFGIEKTEPELQEERQKILNQTKLWFVKDTTILKKSLQKLENQNIFNKKEKKKIKNILIKIYSRGYLRKSSAFAMHPKKRNPQSVIRTEKKIQEVNFDKILKKENILLFIQENSNQFGWEEEEVEKKILNFLINTIEPNVNFDANFTKKEEEDMLKNISYTRGLVKDKSLIISKGQVVEDEKLPILNSLKNQYESKTWRNHHYLILISYGILVLCGLLALLFFLQKERPEIFYKNKQVIFIFFNILLLIFSITFAMRHENIYVYLVPLSVIPIVLKTFFDSQVALFAHIVTLLSLGFIVPNSFEFLFLQIIAGIVSILNIEQLYKRANLFLTILKITIVYMITYVAFNVLHEGNITKLDWRYFVIFLLNGTLSLLTLFLIWFYEKIFGLVSDITLLELSNTSSPLLQQLNEKASGTFQHSIQVANLSGSAAKEIGANALLVRTGALYHDIGKMENAQYFTENQNNLANPQDHLSPSESAKIILNHVSDGVKIAQKHKLPKCLVDFIQTHHGTTFVYYFLKQQKDSGQPFKEKDFRYEGPVPFSKEMIILMLCDAVEAACKSLEKPNGEKIDNLIDRIFQDKIQAGQFENAPITFRELIKIREVLKQKIKDIYHIRIQYPK